MVIATISISRLFSSRCCIVLCRGDGAGVSNGHRDGDGICGVVAMLALLVPCNLLYNYPRVSRDFVIQLSRDPTQPLRPPRRIVDTALHVYLPISLFALARTYQTHKKN